MPIAISTSFGVQNTLDQIDKVGVRLFFKNNSDS